ncbi:MULTISPECIES: CcmD family protein [Cyclobacterium]|uniref:CcmD family protein n=1 Tax=Cyclobacterium plantarum TaxID=2716263 RepID=A0ABX0HAH0_9BACT|nr:MULTISPECIES: CcmD family protein [Cyclobacterium]MBD3628700.1 CcmD family protein [Cyclobacterium sp.]NHE58360.1 CcmD family protein [Cyclobacterium plantarum]
MKKCIVILLLIVSFSVKAQDKIGITEEDYQNSSVQMADGMRSEGKIYVLVAIIGIVLGGILVYVIQTDRKISGLEEKFKN